VIRTAVTAFLLTIALCGTSVAQRLPGYYPESFQRTGTVDDVDDDRIVINDVPYGLSSSVVVHTLFAQETFVSALRKGTLIGYQVGEDRQIVEIWALPDDYDVSKGRR